MALIAKLELSHKKAMADIIRFSKAEDMDTAKLINWLLETEINPYAFLECGFAAGFATSTGFASLCHYIYHALVDDGDIRFFIVKGNPIIFLDLRDDALEALQRDPEVTCLESVDEFIIACDKHHNKVSWHDC